MSSPLTHEEYQALLVIVQRAPMTMPELIALRAILAKLEPSADGNECPAT